MAFFLELLTFYFCGVILRIVKGKVMTENIKKFKQIKHLEAHTKKEYELLEDERKTYEGEIANLIKYINRVDEKQSALKDKLNTNLEFTLFDFKASDVKSAFAKIMNIDESELEFDVLFNRANLLTEFKINILQYVSRMRDIYISIHADNKKASLKNGMCFKVSIEDLLNKNQKNIEFVCKSLHDGRFLSTIKIKEGREKDLLLVMNAKYLIGSDPELAKQLLTQDALSSKRKPSVN